ncbi:phosphoribosylaminoimidazolecarboxamide formyltransferase / IMP cyclohydrolase [Alkalithermobacter thermoalcaliphilus JW-YL-7 = DSM 7308]|uniref:Bifunctional purine biosynthesis protein PurH n=1 Tax=Alkalithermobacter thermoalcaliphilus JW-YL-7 = DSM 7308 TaxID=1121328 RepID=A0A150FNB0_CLOPD|nr:Bifunctional purine biosynthesis protein purH [[Clostridium] paradoxum JW-YL-7 = DSM 7308]SHK90946.1 phosphoribosylaminoimidazolecarboxamide formyltransferase / IMP cyclohydrolase [[Clostridium] paradoxum JW-YL-7 = DSM 7308]
MSKRALISVTNKDGIAQFAKELSELGYEIISTGNTYKALKEAKVDTILIEEVTKFPEILDGRVKTLNPYIHGGILFKRDNEKHIDTVKELDIKSIDIVVVNLYNFKEVVACNKSHEEIIENIDIGGPSMIRSAAKNYKDVLVVVDPSDYSDLITKLKENKITMEDRLNLASKAFSVTAHYENLISSYFVNLTDCEYPKYLNITFEKEIDLRYGENPHQSACLYKNPLENTIQMEKISGKELSFNNINDIYAAIDILREFKDEIVSVAIKHTNPCAVAVGKNGLDAFDKCLKADEVSIFGGIVGINSTVDENLANALNSIFLEVVLAYDYTEKALEILTKKKNLRILKISNLDKSSKYDLKYVDSKLLIQQRNNLLYEDMEVVTDKLPTESQISDMKFGLKVVKHMKSNAVAIVKDGQTLALGPGQTSRIWALVNAISNNKDKDLKDAVLVSDAFFPFDDCVKLAQAHGISAIVQPGGSINDKDSINACNQLGISMVFSKIRHFKH